MLLKIYLQSHGKASSTHMFSCAYGYAESLQNKSTIFTAQRKKCVSTGKTNDIFNNLMTLSSIFWLGLTALFLMIRTVLHEGTLHI